MTRNVARSIRIQKRRAKIRERDGDRCFYCGVEMIFSAENVSAKNRATLEHLVDECRGGSNEMDNLRLAHGRCNSTLNQHNFDEKMELRQRRLLRNIRRGKISEADIVWEVPRPRCYDPLRQAPYRQTSGQGGANIVDDLRDIALVEAG
jgi:hypothetical protein